MLLFGHAQPYSEARKIPGDILLELLEVKLDESLSYLEGDNPRRARQEVAITREFGSVSAFVNEAKAQTKGAPAVP